MNQLKASGVHINFTCYIGNRGVSFIDFYYFSYEIFNIDVECTKIVSKMETMDRITRIILKIKILENFCLLVLHIEDFIGKNSE